MTRHITSRDLKGVQFPKGKSGYDPEKVDAVMAVCADTIESLENQIEELQRAVAMARAESSPMELASQVDEEDAIAQWLTTLDPTEIDLEVQKNIAEAIVESTMAASHIRSEARERVKQLIDAVASEVQKLIAIVRESKSSVAASADLPLALAAWEGEFSTRIGTLLQQLQLPWTVQVSQLAKVLSHMVDNPSEGIPAQSKKVKSKIREATEDGSLSIRRSQTNSDDNDMSTTTKGTWS
jgi:DivIVA domain-containing protein